MLALYMLQDLSSMPLVCISDWLVLVQAIDTPVQQVSTSLGWMLKSHTSIRDLVQSLGRYKSNH